MFTNCTYMLIKSAIYYKRLNLIPTLLCKLCNCHFLFVSMFIHFSHLVSNMLDCLFLPEVEYFTKFVTFLPTLLGQ